MSAAEQSNAETTWWLRKLRESSFTWKMKEPNSEDIKKVRQAELGRVRLYHGFYASIALMTYYRNFKRDSYG